jgi:hypothetical protein
VCSGVEADSSARKRAFALRRALVLQALVSRMLSRIIQRIKKQAPADFCFDASNAKR